MSSTSNTLRSGKLRPSSHQPSYPTLPPGDGSPSADRTRPSIEEEEWENQDQDQTDAPAPQLTAEEEAAAQQEALLRHVMEWTKKHPEEAIRAMSRGASQPAATETPRERRPRPPPPPPVERLPRSHTVDSISSTHSKRKEFPHPPILEGSKDT